MTTRATDASKRRDKLIIMAEIMDISRNGALKTQIMYKANLSFSQLQEYLALLISNNLLTKISVNGREVYKATSKGIEFLSKHMEMMELLCVDSRIASIRLPPGNLLRNSTY